MFKKLSKHFFYILLISIYFISAKNIDALEFVKGQENPLKVNYINGYANELQHHIFKEGNVYKGIFIINRPPESYYSLGYFESADGINWQMKKEILNIGADLSNPSLIKTQTGYILFITRYDNNTIYRIYSSACDFDFNCSSNLIPVITPDLNIGSENKGVFAGHTYKQNDRTYMFFGAWGTNGFKLKLAYSDNLLTWQRCQNEFLYGGDGPFPYQIDNDLYLFFHRSDSSGIKYAKTTLPLSCSSTFADQGYILTKDKPYDQKHMVYPSVMNDDDVLRLYYSGRGVDDNWHLIQACGGQGCLSPTATPAPTVTFTPTPAPTETPAPVPEKTPIIIIPGFMASWNKNAILHNQTVSYSDWKLQNFVTEYDGLINTLTNINYQKEVNIFLFPYDWRQSIEKTTGDLNNYLQEKVWNDKPNQKINIVGHSLGGLIGRIFAQRDASKVSKIISVGSPHFGTVQVYKPLESGEIDRDNTFLWLAEKIILFLNKSEIESDRVTFTNKFQVAKDLFPTFNFLKDLLGNEIQIDSLTIKNSFLNSYNQNFSGIFPIFNAIYGEKDKNTPAGYIVEPQNIVDKLLGNYSDGKPKETYFDFGDYTILSKSAAQDTDSEKLYSDHGEIITQKESIKKILDLLNIKYQDEQIIEGKGTIINPALIFMIRSPATISVEFGEQTYREDDGIIFIPNAQSGIYNIKVKGIDQGGYEVIVGQISKNNDIWESIKGEITELPAESQIDKYNLFYDNETAFAKFPAATISPALTPTPTFSPTQVVQPTATPTMAPTATLVPTSTPQPTNSSSSNQSIQSKNDGIPISKESIPMVLGTLSSKEELITPAIKIVEQTEVKNETKKPSKNLDYIWPSITSLVLGGIGYLLRKKIFKK